MSLYEEDIITLGMAYEFKECKKKRRKHMKDVRSKEEIISGYHKISITRKTYIS